MALEEPEDEGEREGGEQSHLGEQGDPWNHLPPLASRIEALAERYA